MVAGWSLEGGLYHYSFILGRKKELPGIDRLLSDALTEGKREGQYNDLKVKRNLSMILGKKCLSP